MDEILYVTIQIKAIEQYFYVRSWMESQRVTVYTEAVHQYILKFYYLSFMNFDFVTIAVIGLKILKEKKMTQ